MLKNECREESCFNNFIQSVIVNEQNKGGKGCHIMTIYNKKVYNPLPLDKEETVANLVQNQISKNRNAKMMTIDEDSEAKCDCFE